MNKLDGKVSVITGGTGGLGRFVVKEFLDEGSRVLSTYIDSDEYADCIPLFESYGDSVVLEKADVTSVSDINRAYSKAEENFGKIDCLVNIVGAFLYKDFTDTTKEDFQRMIDINLTSCFLCSREVMPRFISNNEGRIVNISARPAIRGAAGMSAYGAAKSAVATLTESIADEIKGYNINVNAVIPGTIDTEQNRKDMPDADFSKLVKPYDIARLIVYLCSGDSSIVRGAVIPALGKTY